MQNMTIHMLKYITHIPKTLLLDTD